MNRIRPLFACLLFVLAVTLAGSARAADSGIAAAENSYAALDYPTAVQQADAVLQQRGLSHDVLARATRVSAMANAAMGNTEQAKKLFILLLMYSPEFKIDPKSGARYYEPFSEARGEWQARGRRAGLDVTSTVQWKKGGQIRAAVRDPLTVARKVVIGYRWSAGQPYVLATVDAAPAVQADVRPDAGDSTSLEYYVRVLDAADGAVLEEGSPELPRSLVVDDPVRRAGSDPSEKKSIFASPWLYVAGAVVLGAAVATFFAVRPTEYAAPSASTAALNLTCNGARCN